MLKFQKHVFQMYNLLSTISSDVKSYISSTWSDSQVVVVFQQMKALVMDLTLTMQY